ncbi:MAG: T9SS type A sorting domain-containing protein [Bacteroidetes bacterium]|nr:T9SS type A sorting domain-containing protein [Bacteroidota bacterium]MCW5897321.1 T9SS type A sorting domain-containing protein [Bacteroidota bacterium]
MRSLMRYVMPGLLCTIFIVTAGAQITINDVDVNRILAPGNMVVNRNDNVATSFNVGSPGLNSWNFSGLQTSTFQVYNSVLASGTPFISNFPGATHAARVDTNFEGINGTVYQYLQLNATGLRNLGNMARATPFPFSTIELRTTVTPAEIVYALPATLGTVWNTAFSNNTRVTLNGQEISNTTTTHDATYTVDGYGTMLLPNSVNSIYALRIRKLNFYNGSPVVSFMFLSRGGAVVICEASDTSAVSGTISVRQGTVVWNTSIVSDSTTDVRTNEQVPPRFSLHQNYPNPFNPSTIISYQVATAGFVSLKVFNMLGEEVATLVNEMKSPGSYETIWNADGLPSGVYFYRMTAGSFTETRRMMVLK